MVASTCKSLVSPPIFNQKFERAVEVCWPLPMRQGGAGFAVAIPGNLWTVYINERLLSRIPQRQFFVRREHRAITLKFAISFSRHTPHIAENSAVLILHEGERHGSYPPNPLRP